ncbi:hypothetical protein GUJ93_ZPchr0007g3481 [Zizania palustris]|uniref:Uncharacterized protein n=1 Tax=Zizania palustris TaxID=103762 RepID=A0A8J5TEN2_ZIZPA|nr:hypothetical protein GUJ93_ZPchr0007g3481 [Zizania palustris]
MRGAEHLGPAARMHRHAWAGSNRARARVLARHGGTTTPTATWGFGGRSLMSPPGGGHDTRWWAHIWRASDRAIKPRRSGRWPQPSATTADGVSPRAVPPPHPHAPLLHASPVRRDVCGGECRARRPGWPAVTL